MVSNLQPRQLIIHPLYSIRTGEIIRMADCIISNPVISKPGGCRCWGVSVFIHTAQLCDARTDAGNKTFVVLLIGTPSRLALTKSLVACLPPVRIDNGGLGCGGHQPWSLWLMGIR